MAMQSRLVTDPGFALAFRTREPAPARPRALLVLLHGVGGNEVNLASLADGVDEDTLVVYPRGRLTIAPEQFAWFPVSFKDGEPQIDAKAAEGSRQALVAFVERMQTRHAIAPARTAIAGFSQGGIMSASVALSAPDRVAGFGVLSGRILPEIEARLAAPAALATLHAFIAHGREDNKLPVSWAQRAEEWLTKLGIPHDVRLYEGGHGVSPAMARDFIAWQDALLANVAQLRLDGESARIDGVAVAPGTAKLQRDFFNARRPLESAIEHAIAAVEDELAKAPRKLRGIRLRAEDSQLRAIARAAGLAEGSTELHRDAVEQVFGRLAQVAAGLPAASAGLPTSSDFQAETVLLRELMQHLDIQRIELPAAP